MEFDMVDNATLGTIIKVVGVGGAGGNAVGPAHRRQAGHVLYPQL